MKATFFDVPSSWRQLLPITYTRPCAELRVGILTLREKWSRRLDITEWYYQTENYLSEKYPSGQTQLWINGAAVATDALASRVKSLKSDEGLFFGEHCIAANTSSFNPDSCEHLKRLEIDHALIIERPYFLFLHAAAEIKNDIVFPLNGKK